MTAVTTPEQSRRRIDELDGFRGMSVLTIVFLHFVVHHIQTVPASNLAYLQKYLTFLWFGVDAFFVLSGYLIGGILIDQRHSTNYFRVFYLRRTLRILPPYLALLLAWLVLQSSGSHREFKWLLDPAASFWPYLLYVQNFAMSFTGSLGPVLVLATWSLAIEEQFYLLFPLAIRIAPPRILPVALGIGILIAPTLRAAMAFLGPDWEQAQSKLLPTRWDSLLLGVLVAWSVRQPAILSTLGDRRRLLTAILAVLAALMALCPLILSRPEPFLSPWRAFAVYLITASFFALVLLLLHLGSLPKTALLLSTRPLRFFGKISYFVYLFHIPVLGVVFVGIMGTDPILQTPVDWAVMLAAFALVTFLGEVSWRYLESPLISLGHRFAYSTGGRNQLQDRDQPLGVDDKARELGR